MCGLMSMRSRQPLLMVMDEVQEWRGGDEVVRVIDIGFGARVLQGAFNVESS